MVESFIDLYNITYAYGAAHLCLTFKNLFLEKSNRALSKSQLMSIRYHCTKLWDLKWNFDEKDLTFYYSLVV